MTAKSVPGARGAGPGARAASPPPEAADSNPHSPRPRCRPGRRSARASRRVPTSRLRKREGIRVHSKGSGNKVGSSERTNIRVSHRASSRDTRKILDINLPTPDILRFSFRLCLRASALLSRSLRASLPPTTVSPISFSVTRSFQAPDYSDFWTVQTMKHTVRGFPKHARSSWPRHRLTHSQKTTPRNSQYWRWRSARAARRRVSWRAINPRRTAAVLAPRPTWRAARRPGARRRLAPEPRPNFRV